MTYISSFLSGLLCSMGFGAGAVLIIFLTSYSGMEQTQAQGINLFFYLPIALFSIIKYKREGLIDFKAALSFIPSGLIGVLIGYALAGFLPTNYLKTVFGLFLLAVGIKELFSKNQ